MTICRIVEERCYSYSNSHSTRANECKLMRMSYEQLECIDQPEEFEYSGFILLASPAYPLKVNSDVRIKNEIEMPSNNKYFFY